MFKEILNQIVNYLKSLTIKTIAIIVSVILIFLVFNISCNRIKNLNNDLKYQEKLVGALTDTMRQYKDVNGNLISEKKTIQADLDILNDKNIKLTNSQRELLERVKKLNKENKVLAAANVELRARIDSLMGIIGIVDTIHHTINFPYNNSDLVLDLTVENVVPYNKSKETYLNINNITLPNKQAITFQWNNDKKNGYPISFTVTNSNKYFQVQNIESYAIPGLDKNQISPTKWQKFMKTLKNGGKYGIAIGIGVAGGFLIAN